MRTTMAAAEVPRHQALREIRASEANVKAPAKRENVEIPSGKLDEQTAMRVELGKAIVRARSMVGWSQKELAAEVDRDHRQVGRWESGEENPNLAALFMLPQLRRPLCVAFSQMAGAVVSTRVEWPDEERKAG